MPRADWDRTCMAIVLALEKRSACLYYKVGCVFINPEHVIVAEGYNGPPRNLPHCEEVGCNKEIGGRCIGAHAELNAITFCNGSPYILLKGSTLYITVFPCNQCMKTLVNCGVAKIVYLREYKRRNVEGGLTVLEPPDGAIEIAELGGIELQKYVLDNESEEK